MKTKLMASSAIVLLSLAATDAAAQTTTASASEDAQSGTKNDIIVTGTRTQGLRAADSAAPVQVLGQDAFTRVGQPDLVQALAQTLPSIQAQTSGVDLANLHPEIKLRGLNPNDTLVLVDGKRRHGTANIVTSPGNFTGAAAPDISLIPEAAIDHIEVLQDGAAAQYGTDAIAGVVNIILKKNGSGGSIDLTGGRYYAGDGNSYDVMGNFGFSPTANTFVNITAERRFSDFTFRGDLDPRIVDTGVAGNGGRALLARFPNLVNAPNYPYVSRQGNPKFTLNNLSYNSGWDITPDIQLYSFGTYSERGARSHIYYRPPSVARGKSATDIPFPLGFEPDEVSHETDYAFTGGLRGEISDTTFDLSSTYGKDKNKIYVDHTLNLALYYDTSNTVTNANGTTTYIPGTSPTHIYDGSLSAWQWTNTLDLTHKFDVGLAQPLNVAAGLEYRRENYTTGAGEPASYYTGTGVLAGGTQGFFGYTPSDAGSHYRSDASEYVDINIMPIKGLVLDGAIRHENYSDFGSATVEKLTGRYDFSPAFAIRGTVSTGFRAPTLAEAFYSGINVNTAAISGLFAPNSPGAQSLGLSGLKPEKSTNYSLGVVAHPASNLTITVDGYSIKLRNRIVLSSQFYGYISVPGTITSPAVLTALRNSGVSVDPVIAAIIGPPSQFGFVSIQSFLNGIDTTTKGIDVVATYTSNFGRLGRVNWSLAANYNKTDINKINPPPANLNPAQSVFDFVNQSTLVNSTPKIRVTAGALWSIGKLNVNVRESYYGSTFTLAQDLLIGTQYDKLTAKAAFITDFDISYKIFGNTRISFGANNLFDVYPTKTPQYFRDEQYSKSNNQYTGSKYTAGAFGFQGGYYYGRISFRW